MSRREHRLEPGGKVRRFDVINGAIGRRCWSGDERARILEETLAPGGAVSAVARRHGLRPQQLFTWRREARQAAETLLAFVPAVIAQPAGAAPEVSLPSRSPRPRRRAQRRRIAAIEIDVGGVKRTENFLASLKLACVRIWLRGNELTA